MIFEDELIEIDVSGKERTARNLCSKRNIGAATRKNWIV
jgi:hypothetical protein